MDMNEMHHKRQYHTDMLPWNSAYLFNWAVNGKSWTNIIFSDEDSLQMAAYLCWEHNTDTYPEVLFEP